MISKFQMNKETYNFFVIFAKFSHSYATENLKAQSMEVESSLLFSLSSAFQ